MNIKSKKFDNSPKLKNQRKKGLRKNSKTMTEF